MDLVLISPSLLAADFSALGNDVARAAEAGADMLHIDVMDGHFVPNISIGLPVIRSLRKVSGLFFDVHLMISHPKQYVQAFAAAGADGITFHLESRDDCLETLAALRAAGVRAGISIKPETRAEEVIPFLAHADMILIMTVEPGFGAQAFMAGQLPKIETVRKAARELRPGLLIQVDGGIDDKTAPLVTAAGADCLVSGSYLFGAAQMGTAMKKLRGGLI